jgi:hypothetical protein
MIINILIIVTTKRIMQFSTLIFSLTLLLKFLSHIEIKIFLDIKININLKLEKY